MAILIVSRPFFVLHRAKSGLDFGYTEILPGQITTDMLISRDGNSFLDFINNRYALGNKDNGIDLNVTKDNQLTFRNASLEIKDEEKNTVASIDGKTGAAMFGKGKVIFDENGRGQIGGWTLQDNNLIAGGNWNGEKLILNAQYKRIELVNKFQDRLYAIGSMVDEENDYPYLELISRKKSTGSRNGSVHISLHRIEGGSFYIGHDALFVSNLPTSPNNLPSGAFWRDGSNVRIVI